MMSQPTLGPFWLDVHSPDCRCSYCGGILDIEPLHFGFNAPETRAWNSWWVFKIGRYYIRWNGFWLKRRNK